MHQPIPRCPVCRATLAAAAEIGGRGVPIAGDVSICLYCGAPLLFTTLNNQFGSMNLNAPIASLPVVIFQFALSPYADWQKLAWTGALIITMTVLALSIVARLIAAPRKSS